MDLLTLLPTLESINDMERNVVATKSDIGEAISYRGTINSVTVNSEDEYTNINQLCLLHNGSTCYLYINHTTRRTRDKYKLSDITTIVITWKPQKNSPSNMMAAQTDTTAEKTTNNAAT